MIQKEHEELKKELEGQQSLMISGLKSMREAETRRNQEVNELKQEIIDLKTELEKSKEENALLKHEMKSFGECKEKVDELTAKLCYAEDVSKYHEQVIRQFKCDGFVNIQPPMLTDALLAKEMTEKENQVKNLRDKLGEMESAILSERERSGKAEKDCEELRGLVTVLQEQRTEDGAYLSEVRNNYEHQVRVLHDEIKRLGGNGSMLDSFGQQSSDSNLPTVTHHGHQNHNHQSQATAGVNSPPVLATEGGDSVFQCDKCRIRVCDAMLFLRHVENCRPENTNIDQID